VFSPRGNGLLNAYGKTESTATQTFLGPEDHDLSTDTEIKEKRLRSVGKSMPDVELGIMDDRNNLLPPGEEGEI
jgi:acyl-CoA synthetase (AMP-forming)/AMP-acid ligase II